MRLQRFIAQAGVASRRAGEQMIRAGRVTVNGHIVRELGSTVKVKADAVEVDGQKIRIRRKLYIALNKPPGFLCTRRDPEGRQTIGDLLPLEWEHLASVGRLDRESEGLIFLTNDGDFALHLTHPRHGIRKTYQATVEGKVLQPALGKLVRGVREGGDLLKAEKARLISANNTRSVLELELAEGKNREVRRLFAAQGFEVIRLCRVRIGPIKLGELPLGKWRALTEPEIKSLLTKRI